MFNKYFRPRSLSLQKKLQTEVLVLVTSRLDYFHPARPTDLVWQVETIQGTLPHYAGPAAECELFDHQEADRLELDRLHLERRREYISRLAEEYVKASALPRIERKESHARIFGWLSLLSPTDLIYLCKEMTSFSSENSSMLLTVFLNRLLDWRGGEGL